MTITAAAMVNSSSSSSSSGSNLRHKSQQLQLLYLRLWSDWNAILSICL